MEDMMIDPVRALINSTEINQTDRTERIKPAQARIDALPSILGTTNLPHGDTTARIDAAGYVYRWESAADGAGFWAQAGRLISGRPRFGQVIDPNDIKWFDMAIYKKKMQAARKKVSAVQLESRDEIWDAARGSGAEPAYTGVVDDDGKGGMRATASSAEDADQDKI
jgi:hypothetical protein